MTTEEDIISKGEKVGGLYKLDEIPKVLKEKGPIKGVCMIKIEGENKYQVYIQRENENDSNN